MTLDISEFKKWFSINTTEFTAILLSTVAVFIATIILTRIFGKRSFSKMSSFDFAMTIAIGSLLATTMLSKSTSLLNGLLAILLVYTLKLGAATLSRIDWMQALINNSPLLLMDGENILYDNLKKARVSESELRAKLRESNVIQISEVRAVIFESTGDISVLHNADDLELDQYLLRGVDKN